MKRSANEIAQMTKSGLNLIKQAISIYDADLRLAVSNRRFQTMFSFPDEMVTEGASFEDTIRFQAERGEYGPVEDLEAFIAERVEKAKAFVPHYFERQRSNGTTIAVEGSPLRQGGWVTVYTDISDIKQQEELLRDASLDLSEKLVERSEELAATNRELKATITALEEAKRELTESEARLNTTNSMTPAHIARVDRDGVYTYSNQKLNTIIPDRPSEIVGLHLSEAVGEEAYAAIAPHFETALAGNSSTFEFPLKALDKKVRVAFTPDVDADGSVSGAYLLSMDITDEANARQALTHARRRELAAQLTSGMAHDFANLLTIILGQQGQLESMSDLPQPAKDIIATTKDAARRGGDLIDGLGQISSRRALSPKPVDFEDFMERTQRLMLAVLEPDHALEIDIKDIGRRVILDEGFTQDALLNLVLNAKEAMVERGSVHVSISRGKGNWMEFCVRDTGPGFSEDALQNAITPFFTTKSGRVGRGLGLSTVFDFAKISGGRVSLENHSLGGAEVRLRVPYKEVSHVEPGLVLLVEDTQEIRVTVRDQLQSMGHAVIEADSVEEAEHLIDLPDLNLVISDLMLKGKKTGNDLAHQLRDSKTPIILITGLPKDDPVRRAAEASFPLLQKPFGPDDLAAEIQAVMS